MTTHVRKSELLRILHKNRKQHHQTFLKAVDIYRDEILKLLRDNMRLIKAGSELRVIAHLNVPEEHTDDYDRAIRMVQLDTRAIIPLDENDARHFLEDDWDWARSFLSNTVAYAASRP